MENEIEIRSGKMQHIIGMPPSKLLQYGTFVIMFSLCILLGISLFLKLPRYFEITGKIRNTNVIEGYVTDKTLLQEIEKGNFVNILFDDEKIYSTRIDSVSDNIQVDKNQYILKIFMDIPEEIQCGKKLYKFQRQDNIHLLIQSKSKAIINYMLK
ncbi:MAG: hypothetical protein ACLTSL_07430 [Odoribacter splanchnicus]